MEKEIQQIAEALGLDKYSTLPQIYVRIGKLLEQVDRNQTLTPIPNDNNFTTIPHYHNGSPCYNNPCVWC